MPYAELHCHSYYSFHDGASSPEELLIQAKELGYRALAMTEHDNLCGAMQFANIAASLEMQGIIGCELTLKGGHHLTLLAQDQQGYANLCRLITEAHAAGDRNAPELPPELLLEHTTGLIVLSGCPKGEFSQLVDMERYSEARNLIRQYLELFGADNYYIELQHNLVYGDTARLKALLALAGETGAKVVVTGNVHYHVRDRHRLQDCLVAVRECRSLEETHRERRANSEFYLRPVEEIEILFRECPEALKNTLEIADRCRFDLTRDLGYAFPDYPAPDGYTPESWLEKLCYDAAIRRYGSITPEVKQRLDEEFRLISKFNLAGFLLMYHEVIKLGREVMIDQGLSDPSLTLEENPPGRGRGSSVALLVGYLIGLSHIDPLKYQLSLERFLPEDVMSNVPDIDLDFPRSIREDLILRTHEKWGWRHAALAGTIATYQVKGAVRDLGKALGLPETEIDQLSKQVEWGSARKLGEKMKRMPNFRDKVDAPVWRDLVSLAAELDGFPKYMGQHPGGMILSSSPLTDIVPVQRGAIDGRYVCQWDKDSIDDAGFVKIDFLALGALSQMQEAVELIKERTGQRIDLSRIDFEDEAVYDMLCKGDTIGIFQVESAAQMQTITRLRPRNLLDMAHEVGAVRPGVGVNHGVQEYLARRSKRKPITYDHPLEQRALERTLGVVLFQDQVNQLAIDVAGFAPSEADRLRRAFGRKHNEALIEQYHQRFLAGAKETFPVEGFKSIPGKGAEGRVNGKEVKAVSPGYLRENNIEVSDKKVDELAAQGKTVIYVIIDGNLTGAIALADIIRPESREAIAQLKAMGIRCMMITGDNQPVAKWVADAIGLDEYFAGVLPDKKAEKVKEVQARGLKVAMTGDGVNDAPALAQADVGIAIGAGTDVAVATADVVLVRSNPLDAVSIVKLSRATYRKMLQNLGWATGYNVIAIPLAAGVAYGAGIVLDPAAGAALMALSTIIVAINARFLRVEK